MKGKPVSHDGDVSHHKFILKMSTLFSKLKGNWCFVFDWKVLKTWGNLYLQISYKCHLPFYWPLVKCIELNKTKSHKKWGIWVNAKYMNFILN